MSNRLTMLLAFVVAMATATVAQTQHGLVKTKGRMVGTRYVAGAPVDGVTIKIKGRNAVLSKANGRFSFTVMAGSYSIESVQKSGYVLTDLDLLSRSYAYSRNDLTVVMEDEAQQRADRQAIERRVKLNMYSLLDKRNAQIEQLKEQNKITDAKYQELLDKLNQDQEQSQALVRDMVDEFARMDFDQIDDFQRQVSLLIMDGQLLKADSLINTKGDLRRHVSDQQDKARLIADLQRKVDKAQAVLHRDNEYYANLCHSKYQLFRMQYENDSAAYYLNLRAQLPDAKLDWMLTAGQFQIDYCANAERASEYFRQALAAARDSSDYSAVYNNIGALLVETGHNAEAFDTLQKALALLPYHVRQCDPLAKTVYDNLAIACKGNDQIDAALDYQQKAMAMCRQLNGEVSKEMAFCYSNMGRIYDYMEENEQARDYHQKAIDVLTQLDGDQSFYLSACYNNLAGVCAELHQYDQAKEYYQKAIDLRKKVLGPNNPRLGGMYNNLGVMAERFGQLDDALAYYDEAVRLWNSNNTFPQNQMVVYGNVAVIYMQKGDYRRALEMFEKGEEVAERLYRIGDADAMLFLPYIQQMLERLAPTSDEYQQRFDHFMDDKLVVARAVKGRKSPAVDRGMEGLYYIVQYNDWNIDSTQTLLSHNQSQADKPKDLVFVKDGQVRTEHFDDAMGLGLAIYTVGSDERARVRKIYEQWKTSSRK